MFSVIVPVYNKLPHLDRSIKSVLDQTFKDFELILVDDSSSDGSYEKLLEFNDSRIRIFRRPTPGAGGYAARNLGIRNATKEWISFLDADDEWDLKFLEKVNYAIVSNPDVNIITSSWTEVDNDNFKSRGVKQGGSEFIPFELLDYLNEPVLMWTSATTIRKNILTEVGGFPCSKPCKNGGDVDTWIRCLSVSENNIHINIELAKYYRNTVNRVTNYKVNTSNVFCAYDSLMNVYAMSDKRTKSAIKKFSNKHIYNVLRRYLDASNTIDYGMLTKMYFTRYAVLRIVKLHIIFIKYLFLNKTV